MENIWVGQTLLPPPSLCLCIEMLKWVCQIYSIPVIIPPARNTGGKANLLVISFLISYTSSKDMAKTLQQNKGKESLLFNQRKEKKKKTETKEREGKGLPESDRDFLRGRKEQNQKWFGFTVHLEVKFALCFKLDLMSPFFLLGNFHDCINP